LAAPRAAHPPVAPTAAAEHRRHRKAAGLSQPFSVAVRVEDTVIGGSPLQNRFHVAALVFQRVRQLKNGARPRVDPGGHKSLHLALLEVLANTVSWTICPKAP
jgi:DNA-directed RNA polymerase subunit K/omega